MTHNLDTRSSNFEESKKRLIQSLPPSVKEEIGEGNFEAIGVQFLKLFIEIAGLKPAHRVLDVGCGYGRIALPLLTFLRPPEGSYFGFDINAGAVRWCREKIAADYPHFRFFHADLKNSFYNPDAPREARQYAFPIEDESIEFVFLCSVFTHLLPEDTTHYFHEIARCLKPGGRCFATFFLLEPRSEANLAAGKTRQIFPFREGPVAVAKKNVPEGAIAYQLDYVEALAREAGFSTPPETHFGSWSAAHDAPRSFQDILVFNKLKINPSTSGSPS